MKNIIAIAAACLLTAGVTLTAIAVGFHLKNNSNISTPILDGSVSSKEKTDIIQEVSASPEVNVGSHGSIIIPGFERAVFKANSKDQNIQLYNPDKNNCYFIISIMLPDDTELFQSEMLAPGDSLSKIALNKILDPGTYKDAILRYSCFDMKTLKGMNGANVKFILEVIE